MCGNSLPGSFDGEYAGGNVADQPLNAAQQVLAGDRAAPHHLPVVRLDAIQVEQLKQSIDWRAGLRIISGCDSRLAALPPYKRPAGPACSQTPAASRRTNAKTKRNNVMHATHTTENVSLFYSLIFLYTHFFF